MQRCSQKHNTESNSVTIF